MIFKLKTIKHIRIAIVAMTVILCMAYIFFLTVGPNKKDVINKINSNSEFNLVDALASQKHKSELFVEDGKVKVKIYNKFKVANLNGSFLTKTNKTTEDVKIKNTKHTIDEYNEIKKDQMLLSIRSLIGWLIIILSLMLGWNYIHVDNPSEKLTKKILIKDFGVPLLVIVLLIFAIDLVNIIL